MKATVIKKIKVAEPQKLRKRKPAVKESTALDALYYLIDEKFALYQSDNDHSEKEDIDINYFVDDTMYDMSEKVADICAPFFRSWRTQKLANIKKREEARKRALAKLEKAGLTDEEIKAISLTYKAAK